MFGSQPPVLVQVCWFQTQILLSAERRKTTSSAALLSYLLATAISTPQPPAAAQPLTALSRHTCPSRPTPKIWLSPAQMFASQPPVNATVCWFHTHSLLSEVRK